MPTYKASCYHGNNHVVCDVGSWEKLWSDCLCWVDQSFGGSGITEHFSLNKSLENTYHTLLEYLREHS